MCRSSIKVENDDLDFNERRWSFIDKNEINSDYLIELDQIFVCAFENLLKNR